MKIKQLHVVFFSASNTTRALVRGITAETGILNCKEYNITKEIKETQINLVASDLLIVGVPSYAGRVPAIAISEINKFMGNNTPAIIVCAYGNRDYDDTLLELRDIISKNGFKIVSAGAFVAQHSIFPKVGKYRPNEEDKKEVKSFAQSSLKLIEEAENLEGLPMIEVKGNYPYRPYSSIPLKPKGDKKCDSCGTCVHLCPTGAIPADNPRKTDKEKCISCARCIAVCPQHSRAFRGFLYNIVSRQFSKKNKEDKENVLYYQPN